MNLVFDRRLNITLAGAVAAAVLGVSLGVAMHPELQVLDRPLGPQMLMGSSASRSDVTVDPAVTLASYKGRVPDYVLGTDAAKQIAGLDEQRVAADEPAHIVLEEPRSKVRRHPHAAYDDEPAAYSRYPSVSGGQSYDAQAPADESQDGADEPAAAR